MNINNLCSPNLQFLVLFACMSLIGSRAYGHSDVFISNVSGTVAIGGANELGTVDESFDLTTRVFEGVMISNFSPIGPADYGRDEPGFHALFAGSASFPAGASALPAGTAVSVGLPEFRVESSIASGFFWDGTGEVTFAPLSTAQPEVELTIDPSPIGNIGNSGAADLHPAFKLDKSGPGVPADGVYLIAPAVLVAGLSGSQQFYMLFLVDTLLGDEETAEELEDALEIGQTVLHGKDFAFFEEAVDFVQQLAVPEPSAHLMAAIPFGVARIGRRRAVQ